jgi:hypothetical protein
MANKRYHQLLELASLLYVLQQQDAVVHPWKSLLADRLKSIPHAELGDVLIRQMTLLNRHNRIREKGAYQSEHNDLLMALRLLQGEYRYKTLLSPRLQLAYTRLKSRLGIDQLFRRTDVERITGYKKTESHRIIKLLEQCDKIEQVGGSRRSGFYYQLRE